MEAQPWRKNPFTDNRPGKSWWRGFCRRHPNIVPRVPTPIGKERAIVSTLTVDHWFDRFYRYMEEVNALSVLHEAGRMFNCDESGFALAGKKGTKVMAEMGTKKLFEYQSSTKGIYVVSYSRPSLIKRKYIYWAIRHRSGRNCFGDSITDRKCWRPRL